MSDRLYFVCTNSAVFIPGVEGVLRTVRFTGNPSANESVRLRIGTNTDEFMPAERVVSGVAPITNQVAATTVKMDVPVDALFTVGLKIYSTTVLTVQLATSDIECHVEIIT